MEGKLVCGSRFQGTVDHCGKVMVLGAEAAGHVRKQREVTASSQLLSPFHPNRTSDHGTVSPIVNINC